jgi:LytS/YehU family sensor histidine kinase
LEQELTYLENFIELEKLRQDDGNFKLTIQFEQPYSGDLSIAPFVLMPFIENAFKHVSQRKDQTNWIRMNLRFDKQQLYFTITNSISVINNSSELMAYSGIGLKNVKRRLDLIYPEGHDLRIEKDSEHFEVTLRLDLHKQKTSEPVPMPVR